MITSMNNVILFKCVERISAFMIIRPRKADFWINCYKFETYNYEQIVANKQVQNEQDKLFWDFHFL